MPAQIFGAPAAAVMLYNGFYGPGLTYPVYTSLVNIAITGGGPLAIATAVGQQFSSVPGHLLARQVLTNVGIHAATIPTASFAVLEDALIQAFAAHPAARGVVVYNALQALTQLEGDATFGAVARAFNGAVGDAYVRALNSPPTTTVPSVPSLLPPLTTQPNDLLRGTIYNDNFNGNLFFNTPTGTFSQTFQTGDTIDGGDGNDTLNLGFDNASAQFIHPVITNIETLSVNSAGTARTQLEMIDSSGVRAVGISNGHGGDIVLDHLRSTLTQVSLSATRSGLVVNSMAEAVAGTADAVAVALSNVTQQVPLALAGYETIALTSGSSSNTPLITNALSLAASAGVRVAVTGTSTLQLALDAPGGTIGVDAAGMGGAASLQLTVASAADHRVVGSANNDRVDFGATWNGFDAYDGGAGTDTIALMQAFAADLTGRQANLSSLEVLALDDAIGAARYTPGAFGGGTTLRTSAIASDASFSVGFGAGRSGLELRADHTGTRITLGAAGTAAGDVLDVSVGRDDGRHLFVGKTGGSVVFEGFETVNVVSGTNAGNVVRGGIRLQSADGPTVLNISGSAFFEVDGPIRADRIDASQLAGGLIMGAASETVTRIVGGAGRDNLTAHEGDTVTGGGGADFFFIQSGTRFAKITDFVTDVDKLVLATGANTVFSPSRTLASAADLAAVRAEVAGTPGAVLVQVTSGAAAGSYAYFGGRDDLLLDLTGIQGTLSAGDFTMFATG